MVNQVISLARSLTDCPSSNATLENVRTAQNLEIREQGGILPLAGSRELPDPNRVLVASSRPLFASPLDLGPIDARNDLLCSSCQLRMTGLTFRSLVAFVKTKKLSKDGAKGQPAMNYDP